MNNKTRKIVGWLLAGIIALVFIATGVMKVLVNAEGMKNAAHFGLSHKKFVFLGITEIVSAILFLYPRTGIVGTLLLAAYMGGAIATHLEHFISPAAPVILETIIWITAVIRFPELGSRLFGGAATRDAVV